VKTLYKIYDMEQQLISFKKIATSQIVQLQWRWRKMLVWHYRKFCAWQTLC